MAVGSPKKRAKKSSSHPTYAVMITAAIKNLKERGGSSRQAILKYITSNYKVDPAKAGTQVRLALKRSINSGKLKQVKGAGASGSFRLPVTEPKAKKKKTIKKKSAAKKTAATKVKKPKAKRKSPKKAKKSPAAKKPVARKARKSPKKGKK